MHAADQLAVPSLAQYGLAGIILSVLLTFGWIVYKRERDRADAKESELAALNKQIIDDVVPALVVGTAAVTEVHKLIDYYRDAPPPRRRP